MNLTNVRQYLSDRIEAIDNEISILPDSFDDMDISSNDAEKGYKITFDIMNTSTGANSIIDDLPVFISIYSPRDRDEESSFDAIYSKAIEIRNHIIDPKCLELQNDFTTINGIRITPSVLETGDKTIKMEIELLIRNDFTFC